MYEPIELTQNVLTINSFEQNAPFCSNYNNTINYFVFIHVYCNFTPFNLFDI